MRSGVVLARVTDDRLDVATHLDAVSNPAAGAVTTFVGQVRDHDAEAPGPVELLDYEAHPDAQRVLESLAARVSDGRSVLVAVSHRTGRVHVGEVAVVVVVAAAHRDDAFAVCRELIELIKTDLPLWKRQVTTDGHSAWTGLEGQPPANGGSTSTTSA